MSNEKDERIADLEAQINSERAMAEKYKAIAKAEKIPLCELERLRGRVESLRRRHGELRGIALAIADCGCSNYPCRLDRRPSRGMCTAGGCHCLSQYQDKSAAAKTKRLISELLDGILAADDKAERGEGEKP